MPCPRSLDDPSLTPESLHLEALDQGGDAKQVPRAYHLEWATDPAAARALAAVGDDLDRAKYENQGQKTPLVVRWWVARRLLDDSLEDWMFGRFIADRSRRILFYAKVGQQYAELGDVRNSRAAFIRAAGEAQEGADQGAIAVPLLLSRRYMCVDVHSALVNDLTERLPGIRQTLKNERALARSWPGEKDFARLLKWQRSGATQKEILAWVTSSGCGHSLADCARIRRAALLLCFGCGIVDDITRQKLIEALDAYVRQFRFELERTGPHEIVSNFDEWKDCIGLALGCAEALRAMRGEESDVPLARVLEYVRGHGERIPQRRAEEISADVGGSLARAGRLREGRMLAQSGDVRARVAAALSVLESELLQRDKAAFDDRLLYRLSFNDGFGGQ